MGELVAFLGVSALVIVTPGQDTALTIRNTLLGGRVAGVFTAVGVSVGQATWTVATSVGIGALLVAFEPGFVALKLAGSVYLFYLGVQALFGRKALRVADGSGGRVVPRAALQQGVLSNLGMTLVWLSVYSVVVTRAGALLRRARVRRAIEAVTGTVLIALGLRLATEQR
jgi:threonine/homoserine/homoserine lactone efflux protein